MTTMQAIHRLNKLAKTVGQPEQEAIDFAIAELSEIVGGYYIIDSVWDIKKQRLGERNYSRYDKMSEWFLKDMEQLTGGTGFTHSADDSELRFFLDGVRYLRFIIAKFDFHTGEFIGVRVFRNSYKAFDRNTTKEEKANLVTSEVNQILIDFEKKATELGYLIQDN